MHAHVTSPAGAAIAVPLSAELAEAYEVVGKELTPAVSLSPFTVLFAHTLQALAYVRARNADPMSRFACGHSIPGSHSHSYGDFAAISGIVDVCTAEILAREVSDGVIAAGYEAAALDILRKKVRVRAACDIAVMAHV